MRKLFFKFFREVFGRKDTMLNFDDKKFEEKL